MYSTSSGAVGAGLGSGFFLCDAVCALHAGRIEISNAAQMRAILVIFLIAPRQSSSVSQFLLVAPCEFPGREWLFGPARYSLVNHSFCGEYIPETRGESVTVASGLVRSVRKVGTAASRLRV